MHIKYLAVCVVLFLGNLVVVGCGPPPAQPTPVSTTALATEEDFQQVVAEIEHADEGKAQTRAGALWQSLVAEERVPLVFGEQVFFLYKGPADRVTWRGDFTEWERGAGLEGRPIGATDLWLAETTLPIDSRANYKIVLDGSEWILDPANSLVQPGGLGDNSILVMPDYKVTSETVRRGDVAPGILSDDLTIESQHLGYAVNYRVYTPANYGELQDLPVLYVTDGNDWAYEPFGAMTVVLDNLIADGRIQPVIAVFVDAREPGNPDNNRRESEFLDRPEEFARFVAQELVPAVDAAYRTDPSPDARLIQGTSFGGVIATYIVARFPELFHKVALFSPAFWILDNAGDIGSSVRARSLQEARETIVEAVICGGDSSVQCPALPATVFMTSGIPQWDVGEIGSTAADLNALGIPTRYIQVQEGHSWGNWSGLLDEMLISFFPPTLATGAAVPLAANAEPVIIDTDMAPDDWLAILFLLQRPDVDVRAITVTGTGETHCEPGVRNAMDLAALAGRPEIPVACGRENPLTGSQAFPEAWRHRADTLAGIALPANPNLPSDQDAVALLRSILLASPEPVTVITLGPLTNLGEALQSDPSLAHQVKRIYIMGGAFEVPGNVGFSGVDIDNTAAEWNLYIDPRSAQAVLESGVPVTFVPLDATSQVPMTPAFYDRLAQDRATPVAEFAYRVLTTQLRPIQDGLYWFWDPLTAVVALEEGLAKAAERRVVVIEEEGPGWGATRDGGDGMPAQVVVSVEADQFETLFLDTLNGRMR